MNSDEYRYLISVIDRISWKHVGYFLIPRLKYTQSISFDAFYNGTNRKGECRNLDKHTNKHYVRYFIPEVVDIAKVGSKSENEKLDIINSNIPIKCASIFEFYDHIKYNYKKKRFDT